MEMKLCEYCSVEENFHHHLAVLLKRVEAARTAIDWQTVGEIHAHFDTALKTYIVGLYERSGLATDEDVAVEADHKPETAIH